MTFPTFFWLFWQHYLTVIIFTIIKSDINSTSATRHSFQRLPAKLKIKNNNNKKKGLWDIHVFWVYVTN